MTFITLIISQYIPDRYDVVRCVSWMKEENNFADKWRNIWLFLRATNIDHPLVGSTIISFRNLNPLGYITNDKLLFDTVSFSTNRCSNYRFWDFRRYVPWYFQGF